MVGSLTKSHRNGFLAYCGFLASHVHEPTEIIGERKMDKKEARLNIVIMLETVSGRSLSMSERGNSEARNKCTYSSE